MIPGVGLYSTGMHGFVLMEAELGTRVAKCQDSEDCGMGVWVDISYEQYIARFEREDPHDPA